MLIDIYCRVQKPTKGRRTSKRLQKIKMRSLRGSNFPVQGKCLVLCADWRRRSLKESYSSLKIVRLGTIYLEMCGQSVYEKIND